MALRHLWAALNAKPFGMFLPPAWIGAIGFGMLGFLHPGLWLIGLGVGIGYLGILGSNKRFQQMVDTGALADASPQVDWHERRSRLLSQIEEADRRLQLSLEERIQTIARIYADGGLDPMGLEAEKLAKLAWLHLRLLADRAQARKVLSSGSAEATEMKRQKTELEQRLGATDLSADLRDSLDSRLEILKQRLDLQAKAKNRLELVEAEIARLGQQTNLIQEQAQLGGGSESLARSVDALSNSLHEAGSWMSQQQNSLAGVSDLLDSPAPKAFLKPKTAVSN
jgi:hypothetical protein